MRKLLLLLPLLVSLTGCSTISKVLHTQTKIDKLQTSLDKTTDQRLAAIGSWSYATDVALNNTNISIAVLTNKRVSSLATSPSIQDIKTMDQMVNQLETGKTTIFNIQEKQLVDLQKDVAKLNVRLDKQTSEQLKNAAADAVELGKYQKWWGLGAVWMGLKRIATHLIWVFTGLAVVYVVVRVFANSNPYTAMAFGVLSHIGGFFIHSVEAIFPNAINLVKKGGQ